MHRKYNCQKSDRNNQIRINKLAHLNCYEVSAHSGDISHCRISFFSLMHNVNYPHTHTKQMYSG